MSDRFMFNQILEEVKGTRSTMERVSKEISEHAQEDAERHGEVLRVVSVLERQGQYHSERIRELEKGAEITGVHSIEELREKYKSSKVLLSKVLWAGLSVAGTVLTMILAFLAHKLIGWP